TYTFTGTNGTTLAGLTAPPSWTVSADRLTWTETVTLTGSGAVPASDLTPALPAGSYQFQASYSGDNRYDGSTSALEPLTINKGDSRTTTVITAAAGGPPLRTLGRAVFGTAPVSRLPPPDTVTPPSPAPTGPTLPGLPPPARRGGGRPPPRAAPPTLTGSGAVPASDLTPALPAGSYQFQASYSGDPNYTGSASGPEP